MTVPPDDARAACRAALLKACESDHSYHLGVSRAPRYWVDVDDAAACMAEREVKLREALIWLVGIVDSEAVPEVVRQDAIADARAALAAAQEVDHDHPA